MSLTLPPYLAIGLAVPVVGLDGSLVKVAATHQLNQCTPPPQLNEAWNFNFTIFSHSEAISSFLQILEELLVVVVVIAWLVQVL